MLLSILYKQNTFFKCRLLTDKNNLDWDDFFFFYFWNVVFIFAVPPTIPSDLVETRTAPFGSTVVMDCKTTLDPPVGNTWYKQGGVLPADATQTNGQLTIPDVKGEDAGTYICTSKSLVGTIDIPTTLIVTGNVDDV